MQSHSTYPLAPRSAAMDDYFGVSVPDPYRGLERLDAPETLAWVAAERELTARYLAAIPARHSIRTRLAELNDYEKMGIPFSVGGRYFYAHNTGLQNQSQLLTSKSGMNEQQLALDPNLLSPDGSLAVSGYVASHDGRLLAYAVSTAGSDWTEWHVRDLTTGSDLPDVLRNTKYYEPVFAKDDRGLYFSAFPAPPSGSELSTQDLDNALYYHALGTAPGLDRKILGLPDHPDWQYEPHLSADGRWLVVRVGEGQVGDKGRENVYLLDLQRPDAAAQAIAQGFDAGYVFAGIDAGSLYLSTTLDAPRGRIIAIDLRNPNRSAWHTVVREGPDAIDFSEPSVSVVDHRLIVQSMHDAHSRVAIYALDGTPERSVELPGIGTVHGFGGQPDDRETFYSFTNLVTPPTLFRFDLKSGQSHVFQTPKVAFDKAAFEQRQVFYPSRDGTRIPLLLAYRKGLAFSAETPVLLYGYGGFGISILPDFKPSRLAWLEMGGVYAIANIRGGGEYGEAWHRQGTLGHKQVVFDDFTAAAEWLIAERYTSRAHLAIIGGSNGGLLVGACVTQHPDLFGAAVAAVGVLDMLRFDRFGQGAGWTGDYGSPHDPEQFKALYAYSPVHRVRAGVRYPAVLIVTGDHDSRVMPMHSFKFAAALQAAQAGPAPVLLDVESASGHHGGTTVNQEIEQSADVYAFLTKNLNLFVSAR